MTCNEFLSVTRRELPLEGRLCNRPRVECRDGFSISIQASQFHYCRPRTNKIGTIYETVELDCPTDYDDLILAFAGDEEHPTDSVYPQVPVSLVDKLLEKHGGISRILPMNHA